VVCYVFLLYCPPVVPTYSRDMSFRYHYFLGISDMCIHTIVVMDEVDFVFLVYYFPKENKQALDGIQRHCAILLCLLRAFLLLVVLKVGD